MFLFSKDETQSYITTHPEVRGFLTDDSYKLIVTPDEARKISGFLEKHCKEGKGYYSLGYNDENIVFENWEMDSSNFHGCSPFDSAFLIFSFYLDDCFYEVNKNASNQ